MTSGDSAVRYRIDRRDCLDAFNDAWSAFADANGGGSLDPARIRGRRLWDFVSDETTIHLYQVMVRRLRLGGRTIRFRFRCDAPDRRRLLAMEMALVESEGVQFTVAPVIEEVRPPVALTDASHAARDGLVVACAWCNRVRLGVDRWVEIEEAVHALELFEGTHVAAVSHGMCPACYSAVAEVLDNPAAGVAGTVTVGALPVEP